MEPPASRRNRSELSVPATRWDRIEKAVASAADVAFVDLEDSVPIEAKAASRAAVIRVLRDLDWGTKPPAFRANGLATPFFYRDLVEVVEAAGDRLELIILPKVSSARDIHVADTLLTQIEMHVGLQPGGIRLEAQIESAEGLGHVEGVASASARLTSLSFGPGDYAASMRMPATSIGSVDRWDEQYPGHRYHYAMARIATAAHANGLRPIDGPVADYRDLDALRRACVVARSLGYIGKWCIHPSQIPIANEVFSPTRDELQWARKVIAAYEESVARGAGVVTVDGTMVDAASIRLARTTLEQQEA